MMILNLYHSVSFICQRFSVTVSAVITFNSCDWPCIDSIWLHTTDECTRPEGIKITLSIKKNAVTSQKPFCVRFFICPVILNISAQTEAAILPCSQQYFQMTAQLTFMLCKNRFSQHYLSNRFQTDFPYCTDTQLLDTFMHEWNICYSTDNIIKCILLNVNHHIVIQIPLIFVL